MELRHTSIRVNKGEIQEQVCTLTNSTTSIEAARTAATTVDIGPTVSCCATSQQGVTTPLESQPVGEHYSRASLIKGLYGARPMTETVSSLAGSSGCSPTFPGRRARPGSEQLETPSAASSEAAVSDLTWKEHQTAGFHWEEESIPVGGEERQKCAPQEKWERPPETYSRMPSLLMKTNHGH